MLLGQIAMSTQTGSKQNKNKAIKVLSASASLLVDGFQVAAEYFLNTTHSISKLENM